MQGLFSSVLGVGGGAASQSQINKMCAAADFCLRMGQPSQYALQTRLLLPMKLYDVHDDTLP